jgi:sugar/nucleoside kinase (ribokinase family)
MHGSINIKFVKQSLHKPGQALRFHETKPPRFRRQVALDMYLLTAIGLTPGGSSTVHIYTQTPGGSSTAHIYTQTPGGSSTVHIYTQTPGGSSTVHIYTQTPGGSSTAHIYTQTPGGSSTAHIYTQTIHSTTKLTNLVGRLSGIRTQSGQTKINDEQTA